MCPAYVPPQKRSASQSSPTAPLDLRAGHQGGQSWRSARVSRPASSGSDKSSTTSDSPSLSRSVSSEWWPRLGGPQSPSSGSRATSLSSRSSSPVSAQQKSIQESWVSDNDRLLPGQIVMLPNSAALMARSRDIYGSRSIVFDTLKEDSPVFTHPAIVHTVHWNGDVDVTVCTSFGNTPLGKIEESRRPHWADHCFLVNTRAKGDIDAYRVDSNAPVLELAGNSYLNKWTYATFHQKIRIEQQNLSWYNKQRNIHLEQASFTLLEKAAADYEAQRGLQPQPLRPQSELPLTQENLSSAMVPATSGVSCQSWLYQS